MNVKADLKNIVIEHLSKVASSFFIDKSIAIVDQSADNRESFLAAADRISKRIALFIDTDLAAKVADILRQEIESRELTPGTKRKHARISLCHRVYVTHNGIPHELYTGNISEGGVYVKSKEPFPAGSTLEISLPVDTGIHIHLQGIVVNEKRPSNETSMHEAGMGIEFKSIGDHERKILREFIKRVSVRDVTGRQEIAINPSPANN